MPKPMLLRSLLAALLLIALHGRALAHAYPDHSLPAAGSVVAPSPDEVRIWFAEKLEPAFSSMEVRDSSGARADTGDARVDATDATLLRASVKKLPPGIYTVSWHVVSVDTHPTEGSFTFTVSG